VLEKHIFLRELLVKGRRRKLVEVSLFMEVPPHVHTEVTLGKIALGLFPVTVFEGEL
jgi:hypothetical protein